ncbi:PLC-like phosphodiesterase [Thelephora ganbajun]|uniref:PLC-like phosphodiesterase n=1 Tax=Thelephora ganbajun TaxID=370292 RepID=A0ACB6ZRU4_THEGA|nr:PLC-like phosphodiesterase [Thelephora ganbajun]
MTKASAKESKKVTVRIDADLGQIFYQSRRTRIIQVENIKELRSGSDARYYREQFGLSQNTEAKWLTIVYVIGAGYKTLHLISPDVNTHHTLDITLRKLHAIREELKNGSGGLEMRQAIWEKQYWKSSDEEKDRNLNFNDVEKMCHRLNLDPPRDELKKRFKAADEERKGTLDFAAFRRFVKALKARPELEQIFNDLTKGSEGRLTFPLFLNFMRNTQKAVESEEDLRKLFVKILTAPEQIAAAVKHFISFLSSQENSAFGEEPRVWMDMTRPLSEYYISSSHNTYLVGNQLMGTSTIEGYIRALLHSCRSVELDIYDGDCEPVIYHGRTLTTKVPVREVCEAIMKYAFVTSPYPIIISAEVHCGVTQQDMLANIMKSVFGDALVSAPVDGRPKIGVLPSPEELRGRVLLKAKNLYVSESEPFHSKDVAVDIDSSETTSSSEQDVLSDVKSELKKVGHKVLGHVGSHRVSFGKHTHISPPLVSKTSTNSDEKDKKKVKMSYELLALLVYTVGVKCRGLNKKETYAPEHVFSLSENAANGLLKDNMMDLIKHTQNHVVRIYPKGVRISSTNYDPHRYWSAGAQLVSLNWQTCDQGLMINDAMFRRNGKAGYVLKPQALREAHKDLLVHRTKHCLKVRVISAQQLPRPRDSQGREIVDKSVMDPYVEVSLLVPDWTQSSFSSSESDTKYTPASGPQVGGATSARVVSNRTKVVKNNGFNPFWNESFSLPFDYVGDMKDLVFVKFAVREERQDNDEPLAQYVIPLGCLRQGYRHIPLHDSQLSQFLFSTLFIHTKLVSRV